MQQSAFPLPLVVDIGSSRRLRAYLVAAHIAGGGAVFLAALPPSAQWSALFLVMLSLGIHLRAQPRLRLRCDQAGAMAVWREERWQAASIASNSVVWPMAIVLRLAYATTTTNANQPRYSNVIVLPDCMPAADFRRLRVWLRWRAKPTHPIPGAKTRDDQ
jgi:toxin CptA